MTSSDEFDKLHFTWDPDVDTSGTQNENQDGSISECRNLEEYFAFLEDVVPEELPPKEEHEIPDRPFTL